MDALLLSLAGLTTWLLRISCQASVVIGLVLLAQWLFRKRLSPRWRYILWSLLLIRLMLPVSPESPFSIFNYAKGVKLPARGINASEVLFSQRRAAQTAPSVTAPGVSQPVAERTSPDLPRVRQEPIQPQLSRASSSAASPDSALSVAPTTTLPATKPDDRPSVHVKGNERAIDYSAARVAPSAVKLDGMRGGTAGPRLPSLAVWLSFAWLGGVLFLVARIVWFPVRLNAQLAQHETATRPAVFEILEQSKRLMGMRKVLPVIQSRAVASPALLGFIRPWLLLPDGMVDHFTPEELRFVFLHELAHLKRRDIAVNWLMTILQILHWFNPLVWFAFSRMRADREVACDELALSFAKADENKSYGQAIIKLLEGFTRPAVLPGLVGILEDKQQMKRRITMIAQFKQMTPWPAGAFALLLALGLVTLTDAQSNNQAPAQSANSVSENRAIAKEGTLTLRKLADEFVPGNPYSHPSLDGRYLLISAMIGTKESRVEVMELATGKKRRIELGLVVAKFSPDANQIAGTLPDAQGNRKELVLLDLDTEKSRTLYLNQELEKAYVHDWSPDGQTILASLSKKDRTLQVALIRVADGSVRVLKSFEWPDAPGLFRFSPDGRWIVYCAGATKESKVKDLFVLATDGSREIALGQKPVDSALGWSPVGNRILYLSNRSGTWDAFAIQVIDGKVIGEAELVKEGIGDVAPMGFTRSGAFYYEYAHHYEDIYLADLDPQSGKIQGAPVKASAYHQGHNLSPDLSADGKLLAYISCPEGQAYYGSLRIRNFETGVDQELKTEADLLHEPRWSPDGKSLLVGVWKQREGKERLYRVDGQTGKLTPVFKNQDPKDQEPEMGMPQWSSDGKSVYYQLASSKEATLTSLATLVRYDLETGSETKIPLGKSVAVAEYPDVSASAVSPSGEYIAFQSYSSNASVSAVQVLSTAGSEARTLVRLEAPEYIPGYEVLAWTPDNQYVLFPKWNHKHLKSTTLWRVPAKGGEPEDLGLKMERIMNPRISRDGRRLAFAAGSWKHENWVMENFLPREKMAAGRDVRSAKEDHVAPVVKTLVSGSGADAAGVLSPDESKIAYADGEEASGGLMVKDLETGKPSKVGPGNDRAGTEGLVNSDIVWSPDSKWMAYNWFWYGKSGASNELRLVAPGGEIKVFKSGPVSELRIFPEDWSSDGKSLLCHVIRGDETTLGIVDVTTGDVREFSSLPRTTGISHSRFSPDGRFMTFAQSEGGTPKVYVLGVNGSSPARLTDSPAEEGCPLWSADGKYVLFSSNRRGTWDLLGIEVRDGQPVGSPFVVRADFGNNPRRMTRSGKLVFNVASGGPDVYSVQIDPRTGEAHTPPKLITKSYYGQHSSPSWSKDGKRMAYLRQRPEGRCPLLCVMSLADGREECFETGMGYINTVHLSPDGKSAAVSPKGRSNELGIYLFALETRQLRPLVLSGDFRPKGFSADGKEFYLFQAGDRNENVAIDVATGKERKLDLPGVSQVDYDISPDKSRIVYVTTDTNLNEIQLVLSDIGFARKQAIARIKKSEHSFMFRPVWSPDGTKLAYGKVEEGKTEVRIRAADGTWERTLATGKLEPHYQWVKWSPDSTMVALTLEEQRSSEVDTLENFLPRERSAPDRKANVGTERAAASSVSTLSKDGNEGLGVLSPDESKIAYIDWGDFSDLTVKDLATGKTTRLTKARKKVWPEAIEERTMYEYPAYIVWSPDSQTLAFTWISWTNNAGPKTYLETAAAGGGPIKVLKDFSEEMSYAPMDWSPDGKSLLCELRKGDRSNVLGLLSIESGEVRQLVSLDWNHAGEPRFSPDGKFIAYERVVEGNRDVYLLALESMQITRLTDGPTEEGGPVWSSDGKYVLFNSNRRGPWDLLAIEVREGKPADAAFVVRRDFGDYSKRMTRSGNLACNAFTGGGRDVYSFKMNSATGETMGPPKLLTKAAYGRNSQPHWSPDGKRIAYARESLGTRGVLCVQSVEDGPEEAFNTTVRSINAIFWAPDGKSLALDGYLKNAEYGIGIFSLETREFKPFIKGLYYSHGFTRDGREFLISKAGEKIEQLAINLVTGQERKLDLLENVDCVDYCLSKNETHIAYIEKDPKKKERTLLVADIHLNDKKVLARATEPASIYGPRWSPDGTKIAYGYITGESNESAEQVRMAAADGSWETTIKTGKLQNPGGAEWSPDGGTLALTFSEPRSEPDLNLIKNLFPKEQVAAR